MRTLFLENCTAARRRQQFKDAPAGVVEGNYIVVTAPCGCQNSTRLGEYNGRTMPTCDGSTNLCDEHAVEDDYDDYPDEE